MTGGEGVDCVVIGAGLAGLRCAHGLLDAGHTVTVVEAGEAVGGRARTVWHDGLPVDRGFQTIFAAYAQTRAFIDAIGIPAHDLRPFAREVVVRTEDRWIRLRPDPRLIGRLPGVSPADLAKLLTDVVYQRLRPREQPLSHSGESATAYLRNTRGYSEGMIELVFRPLFSSILLDRELETDCGYFMYLFGLLARGPAMIPSDGVGMIAEWAASAVRQQGGAIELGCRVSRIDTDAERKTVTGVTLDDGRTLPARTVVVAVEAPAARTLLADVDPAAAERLPPASASTSGAAFHLDTPLYEGATLLLNGTPDTGDRPRIDLVCQTSNLTRPGSPDGHVVHVQSVTTGEDTPSDEEVLDAVGRALARWVPGFDWRRHATPIGVWHHEHAQFRATPGVREAVWGVVSRFPNLILAGDTVRHPSIEGAVGSGVAAAAAAGDALDLAP